MPSSGGGTGTPISPIPGVTPPENPLVQPLPWTILSLNRYAKVMGINPAHFWGCTGGQLNPMIMPASACESVWHQYGWQDGDKISRHDLAIEIVRAEKDIAEVLGYWPGPMWITDEDAQYPGPYRREYLGDGSNILGMAKSINVKWGKIIQTGERALTLIATATVGGGGIVYSDEDSDGLYETATVIAATTLTNVNELKVFYAGYDGQLDYEIRDPRRKYLSGGYVFFVFDSWQLVKPWLYEQLPSDGADFTIDISTTVNLLTDVDVYREYVDTTQPGVTFYWENAFVECAVCGGAGCAVCGNVSQTGCIRMRNPDSGEIVPFPATYDATSGLWGATEWEGTREPDRLTICYQSGLLSEGYKAGRVNFPIPHDMERAIAFLATSRLERPLCGCSNVAALSDYLRQDATRASSGMFFTTTKVVENPFGTRVGEIQAWKICDKIERRRARVAVL